MPKKPIVKKTAVEKAVESFLPNLSDPYLKDLAPGVTFNEIDGVLEAKSEEGNSLATLTLTPTVDKGDVLQFMHMAVAKLDACYPPTKLGGNGKDLEDLLLSEAQRLEKLSILTMGRYGVKASLVDHEWRPISSLPDFEGVMHTGNQFVIEAKVGSGVSLPMDRDHVKFQQIRHMITRCKFNVECFLLVHFNSRLGATFYDHPFTVALPVSTADRGGWEVWEKYAANKNSKQKFPAITRAFALEIGKVVRWHIPARAKILRPDLSSFLTIPYPRDHA